PYLENLNAFFKEGSNQPHQKDHRKKYRPEQGLGFVFKVHKFHHDIGSFYQGKRYENGVQQPSPGHGKSEDEFDQSQKQEDSSNFPDPFDLLFVSGNYL